MINTKSQLLVRGLSHSYFAPYGRSSKMFIIIIMVSRIGRAWVIQIFGFSWSKSYTFQKLEEQNFATFVLVNVAKLSHPVLFLFALSSFHWTGHQRGEQTQELRMYLWRKWAKWKGLSTKYYDYEQSVLQCNSNVMTDKLKASLVCEQRKDYQPFLTKLLPVYCSLALWSGWKDRDEDLFKSGRHRTGCLLRMHNFCNSMSFQE